MISFIVPVYNAHPYLVRCIESILMQDTNEPIQLIVVDDGSTDDGLSLLQAYARMYPNIEVYAQQHSGQSAARNLGLSHAKGEYIAFVDADDCIKEDWCQTHLNAIKGVDYVQSGYFRERPFLPKNRYQFTSPCMRLYRSQAIAGMRFPEGMIYEDVLFSVELWLRNASCRMIPYAGYGYIENPDSTTSTRRPEAEQQLFKALKEKLTQANIRGKMIILYTIIRLKLHFKRS